MVGEEPPEGEGYGTGRREEKGNRKGTEQVKKAIAGNCRVPAQRPGWHRWCNEGGKAGGGVQKGRDRLNPGSVGWEGMAGKACVGTHRHTRRRGRQGKGRSVTHKPKTIVGHNRWYSRWQAGRRVGR